MKKNSLSNPKEFFTTVENGDAKKVDIFLAGIDSNLTDKYGLDTALILASKKRSFISI